MAGPFQPSDEQALRDFLAENPLAWLVSRPEGGFHATPLPLLAEYDEAGALTGFLGHVARHPHHAALERDGDALLLFQGAQGYIPHTPIADPRWAPTWNYMVARFHVRITLLPDQTDHALRTLVDRMEAAHGDGWSVEQMGERYASLRQHVVGFRAAVLSRQVTFKLGQDENAENFHAIAAHLPDRMLAGWMRRERGAHES